MQQRLASERGVESRVMAGGIVRPAPFILCVLALSLQQAVLLTAGRYGCNPLTMAHMGATEKHGISKSDTTSIY
jgi:hypothetical protein